MDTSLRGSALDFEIYLLVSMKYGMINREAELDSKLSEHGLSFAAAERIHQQVALLFAGDSPQFETLMRLVGATSATSRSLSYGGVLWPEFTFTATEDANGALASARYSRTSGRPEIASSPIEQPPWSVDSSEFDQHFGPATITYNSPLFDPILPAHEIREFRWEGSKYGAGFSWGLFLFASKIWT